MFLRQTNQVGKNTLSLALPIRSELSLAWHAVHLDIAKFCVICLSNILKSTNISGSELSLACVLPCCTLRRLDCCIGVCFFLHLVTPHLSRGALSQEVSVIHFVVVSNIFFSSCFRLLPSMQRTQKQGRLEYCLCFIFNFAPGRTNKNKHRPT